MRLHSQLRTRNTVTSRQRRFPLLRWVRSRSRWEKEMFVKACFALLTAAIAIYAVSLMAQSIHAVMQDTGH